MRVESSRRIRIVVLIGLVFLFLSAAFPPRRFAGSLVTQEGRYTPERIFIYSEEVVRNKVIEIDLSRVLLEWMIIACLTAGTSIYLTLGDKANGEGVAAPDTRAEQDSS